MNATDQIVDHLRKSIADDFISKDEKRALKDLVIGQSFDPGDLNFLRNKVHELANEKINADNFRFVLEWVKAANNALTTPAPPPLDVFFSPGDECQNAITSQIQSATRQLLICVFTISDDVITRSLVAAHNKGINIRLITDNEKSFDKGSDIQQLAQAGISVRMDTSPNHMHHKFMVVDQKRLLTGSYNWTRSAARFNHENIIVTENPTGVKVFSDQFEKLWIVMEPFSLNGN